MTTCPLCNGVGGYCEACDGSGCVSSDLGELLTVVATLHAAYLRRKSGSWTSFASAMQSPVLARLILQEAHHPTVQATIKRPEVVRPDPPASDVSSPVAKPRFSTDTKRDQVRGSTDAPAIDFKSLAAGERPDADP